MTPAVSIIIPTLNEEANLARLLVQLEAGPGACAEVEIIVVDGGSGDGTREVARSHGVRLVAARRGRGGQLAAGAALARGDILFFLHADSRLKPGAVAALRLRLAETPEAVGGNFRIIFARPTSFDARLTRFYAWLRRHGLYYGDSAIFVRRSVYQTIGGFRDIAVMEDYDFVRRLEAAGPTLCISEPPVTTSSRRFEGRKSHWIIWGWLKMHALFALGISPARLATLYERNK